MNPEGNTETFSARQDKGELASDIPIFYSSFILTLNSISIIATFNIRPYLTATVLISIEGKRRRMLNCYSSCSRKNIFVKSSMKTCFLSFLNTLDWSLQIEYKMQRISFVFSLYLTILLFSSTQSMVRKFTCFLS